MFQFNGKINLCGYHVIDFTRGTFMFIKLNGICGKMYYKAHTGNFTARTL